MNSRPLDKDVKSLLTKLLINYRTYFTKDGMLNSEGRKLFECIARLIIRERSEYKELISKIRKNPTLRNIFQVVTLYMEEGEAYKLLCTDYLNNATPWDNNYL